MVIPIERLRESQTPRSTRHIGNRNYFLKTYYLHRRHNHKDVYVAGEHAAEEDANHDKGPDGPSDECLLLLFVVGLWLLFWRLPWQLISVMKPINAFSLCGHTFSSSVQPAWLS